MLQVQCSARPINAALSRNGKHLLINYQDKAIRAFDLPAIDPNKLKKRTQAEVQKALSSIEVGISETSESSHKRCFKHYTGTLIACMYVTEDGINYGLAIDSLDIALLQLGGYSFGQDIDNKQQRKHNLSCYESVSFKEWHQSLFS